jgi:HSP20 family molecular chaperone IbpA
VPGVRNELLDVSVDASRVSISATFKEDKEAKEGDRVLQPERCIRSYAQLQTAGRAQRRRPGSRL